MNHESIPGPVAMASHSCSGVAPTSATSVSSNSYPTSGLLRDARVHGDDHAVRAALLGRLVVVLPDQRGDGGRQFLGEGGPVGGGGEPHLAVERERRQALLGLGGTGDQQADV